MVINVGSGTACTFHLHVVAMIRNCVNQLLSYTNGTMLRDIIH